MNVAGDLASGALGLIPEQVMRSARRFPDRTAVGNGAAGATYAALLAESDRAAAALRARGIGAGGLVGLCLPRGVERIAALWAIWRVGAAAVMLDPAWPPLRLAQIAGEAGCALAMVEGGAPGTTWAGMPLLPWEVAARAAAPAATAPDDAPLTPDDLAYVIYTSGSTGRPKGVEITHGNLAALVAWHVAAFAVSPADRATHLAGLAFDAAVWEVWPYLATGASVHLAPEPVRTASEQLRDWLVATEATIAFAPTLLAERLVRLSWPATALRTLLTGGDRLHAAPPAGLPFTLVNNYGPTECTVVACSGPVPPAGSGGDGGPPAIGRPIAGSSIHILDEAGTPVPAGAVGEIWIGGDLVGRGYRGQAEATAHAFVPDRWSDRPGARLYRTGDLGSVRADGTIDFHGRVDEQLKIRGHRVEPGEVAAQLATHPQVRAAAVIGVDQSGETTLAAYVEPEGEAPTAGQLHAYLGERLPDWAVPARFVPVDRLPVTANGKLDRAALPLPAAEAPLPEPPAADAGPVEARLLDILRTVLGGRQVGVEDNFFLLGGHSLLGTQVVLRASEAFGIELTLRDLFHAPTVRALAARVEQLAVEMVAALSEDELMLRTDA